MALASSVDGFIHPVHYPTLRRFDTTAGTSSSERPQQSCARPDYPRSQSQESEKDKLSSLAFQCDWKDTEGVFQPS